MTSSKYGTCQSAVLEPLVGVPRRLHHAVQGEELAHDHLPHRGTSSLVAPNDLPPVAHRTGLEVDPEIPSGNAEVMPCGSTVHDPSRIHAGIVRPPGHCPSPIAHPSTLRLKDVSHHRGVPEACVFDGLSGHGTGREWKIALRVRSTRGAAGTVRTRPSRPHPPEICCLDEQFLVANMKE